MKEDIELDKLIINPENYRFDPVDTQEQAIDLMLEEKGPEILNLAKHIFERGLDQAKDSRVIQIKKGLYSVLDGNRRMTALKCLDNPNLVKNDILRTKFAKILQGNGSVPNRVNCYVYKDEAEAAEWIKLDHTGKNNGIGQDAWEPAGKDRFDYKFGGKQSPAMQVLNLFKHETKQDFNTKSLKMSTINRILSNPEARAYLGIDTRSGLNLVADKKEVVSRLDTFFNKIIADDVPVSEVYKAEDAVKFMKDLFDKVPRSSTTPSVVTPTGIVKSAGTKSQRSIPKTTARGTLIPKGCVLIIPELKINNVYHELKTVQLEGATNAIGVLFRVFLEICLDHYANKNGIAFSSNTKLAGKVTKVADDLEKKKVATQAQLRNIRSVSSKGNSILSIDNFHEYVHSIKTQPVPIDLIYKWDNLQEFFEILWEEINKKTTKTKKK